MKSVLIVVMSVITTISSTALAQPFIELEVRASDNFGIYDGTQNNPQHYATLFIVIDAGTEHTVLGEGSLSIDPVSVRLELTNSNANLSPTFSPMKSEPDLVLTKEDILDPETGTVEILLTTYPNAPGPDLTSLSFTAINYSPTGISGSNELSDFSFFIGGLVGTPFTSASPNLPSDPSAYYLNDDPIEYKEFSLDWGGTYNGNTLYSISPGHPVPFVDGAGIGLIVREVADPNPPEPCPADLTGDRELDFADISTFIQLFGKGCP